MICYHYKHITKYNKNNSFIALFILTTMNVVQGTEPTKPQQTNNHAVPSGEHAHERPADIEALVQQLHAKCTNIEALVQRLHAKWDVQRLHAKWGNHQPGTGASGR
jgi:transcription termination factor NusB